MQKSQSKASSGGFGLQDILYIVFKHKWKIIVLSLLGIGAAATVYKKQVPIYKSTAKLLVRYVVETPTIDPYAVMKSPGGGDSVILTEFEILKSMDLAGEVADAVNAEIVLNSGIVGEDSNLGLDATVILDNLEVTSGDSPNVLYLTYGNLDPKFTKIILGKIVELYFKKHLEIHRSPEAFDAVALQTEEVRQRLEKIKSDLDALRTNSGIVSLKDVLDVYSTQKAKTKGDLSGAEAELVSLGASINFLDGREKPVNIPTRDSENSIQVPAQAVTDYRIAMDLLGFLRKRDVDLRLKFKSGSRLLAQTQEQIENYESKRRALVEKYPNLAREATVLDSNDPESSKRNLDTDMARQAAITAKIKFFRADLEDIANQFKEQYEIGARIDALDSQKAMTESEYRTLELKLKDAKLNQTLDPASMPNITLVQKPSDPIKSFDPKVQKIVLGLAGSGLAIGVGLAFVIELLFDRRVKRPTEIQTRLQIPLLLSIPNIRRKDRGGLMLTHDTSVPRIGQGGDSKLVVAGDKDIVDSGIRNGNHFIHPYAETIRDRIIFNFEINNVTHKPKFVAVTGLSDGAGTSTIAAGMAKSFSEINGSKVLLVDLSSFHPEESPLFGEVHRHSLNGALQLANNSKFRENEQRLYYASATARRDDSGLTTFSPLHLYELMPQLQASDYDYIIFDMPPLDQTSRTLTMAGLMDKVILVLDAENTSRDTLKWGYSELIKGKADVSCIFNKTRAHAPSWIIGDS